MEEKPDKYTNNRFEAYLGHYVNFWSYLTTYKNAFKVLVNNLYNSGLHVDHMAYPMLFIARHCMELGFKANIRYFSQYSDKNDYRNADTHDLEKLFWAFKHHVNATVKNLKDKHGIEVDTMDVKSFEEYCQEVSKLTNIFHVLDRKSDNFRYPVDKKNVDSFEHDKRINILDVKELFDKSMILLEFTCEVFKKYTDFFDEIERMYEEEMKLNNWIY